MKPKPIQWLTTAPNPRVASRSQSADAGQRGWKMHAVFATESTTLGEVCSQPALCGLLPTHGWGLDMFIEDKCARCLRAIAKETK